MRTIFSLVIVGILGFVLTIPSFAQYDASYGEALYARDGSALPQVSAPAWGAFDSETGELLFGKDVHSVRPIASVTKLMTARVTLNTLPLDATTTLSRRAIATEGGAGELKAGEVMSIRELLFPLLLPSSNDAAEAIAEFDGRDAFLADMNETARNLGMSDTHYADPSGLSPQSVSSVSDLATLVHAVASTDPYLLDISRLGQYVGATHIWHNADKISFLDTFRGGKHGYTDEADRTLAARFEEPLANGVTRTVIIVLLGSANLHTDVESVRTYLHEHVTHERGSALFVIMHTPRLWNLLTQHFTENIAQVLSPIYAVKDLL